MDLSHTACTPHPLAHAILFKHKRTILSVFSDVIGINNIDHLSIACITPKKEVMFLSHTPSIEYHLITANLLPYDLQMHPQFYTHEHSKSWSELYHPDKHIELHAIKQKLPGFTAGLSIPLKQDAIHLVYSFATKSHQAHSDFHLASHNEFMNLGHYCFNKLSHLVLPHVETQSRTHRHLQLVINNTRNLHHAAST